MYSLKLNEGTYMEYKTEHSIFRPFRSHMFSVTCNYITYKGYVTILLPTIALYLTYKILNIKIDIKTLLYSHSYMFRSVQTIIRGSILSLAKVTFFVDTISKNMSL